MQWILETRNLADAVIERSIGMLKKPNEVMKARNLSEQVLSSAKQAVFKDHTLAHDDDGRHYCTYSVVSFLSLFSFKARFRLRNS